MKRKLVWHNATVTRQHREVLNGHRGVIVWFTGLSGAGKSTLAHSVEERLHQAGCRTFVFDGDNVRHGLCFDLGFSARDRQENVRRIGEMSRLFIEAGVIALTAFISPFRADRDRVRRLVGPDDFLEVYCHCPIEICEERDVKGMYQKARRGEIPEFTGISSPYEEPLAPELALDTGNKSVAECASGVLALLRDRTVINRELRCPARRRRPGEPELPVDPITIHAAASRHFGARALPATVFRGLMAPVQQLNA